MLYDRHVLLQNNVFTDCLSWARISNKALYYYKLVCAVIKRGPISDVHTRLTLAIASAIPTSSGGKMARRNTEYVCIIHP